jgi:hypothetical protein
MKNLIPHTSSHATRSTALTALAAAVVVAVAAGILAGAGNAAPASAAGTASPLQKKSERFKAPTLVNGLLTVKGTNAGDRIALRLQAGQPGIVEVDFGDDGSAEFSFERREIAAIAVEAGNGADAVRIDEINGVFADTIPTTIDGGNGQDRLVGGAGAGTLNGGNGNDALFGGNGNETLLGGNGNDTIDGNRGNDLAFMGNGNDTFVWDPGDGSDTVEGQNGTDTMLFNGANIAEQVDLSANGHRLRFFRDIANITMDTNGVERVDFNALGGDDVVTVNDLSGTDVEQFNVDLAGSLGGATGDGAGDSIIVNGTDGDDTIKVKGDADDVKVSGLVPTVNVLHPDVGNDRLEIKTLAGTDTVKSAGLAAGAILLFVDGVPDPVKSAGLAAGAIQLFVDGVLVP